MNIKPEYAKPILNLSNALSERNIPHTINVLWDGLQIHFPWNNGDIICHSGSFGHEVGDVESMACPWDDEDVSHLTVKDAVDRIITWWQEVGV